MFNKNLSDKANLNTHLILFVLGVVLSIINELLWLRILWAVLALFYAVAAVLDLRRMRKDENK